MPALGVVCQDRVSPALLVGCRMYPYVFRPSTTCTVNDDRGHVQMSCPIQVFKPLLGCAFNGPQPLIVGHSIPNMAGMILRGLVGVYLPTALDLRPGPFAWGSGKVPWFVLSEDPNSVKWRWLDALPWSLGAELRLWSFFAAVDPEPPPPPPPPVPIELGATSGTGTLVALDTDYVAVLPPLSVGWGYLPMAGGTDWSVVVQAGTYGSMLTAQFGGSHLGALIPEGTPVTGPGTTSVVGGSHVGPDGVIRVTNPDIAPQPIYFRVTSP